MTQSTLTCIAIDDDPLFLAKLDAFIEEITWLHLVDKFTNPVQAATAIVKQCPEILLLDIEMPYIDGYEMLDWITPKIDKLHPRPHVVVISGKRDNLFYFNDKEILCSIFKSELTEPGVLEQAIKNALPTTDPTN